MNFFFGLNNKIFKSEIQIPIFKNRIFRPMNLKLFKCHPEDNRWKVKEVLDAQINKYFYVLKNEQIANNEIYFLADESKFHEFDEKKLKKLNSHTDTKPAFRANFKIYINNGGFSSFQSEYPYSMTTKKGMIVSSICSIANPKADKNYILIRNIFENPIVEKFNGYLVDIKSKKIMKKFKIKTNYTNFIEINDKFIKPEIYLVTDKYLSIPMYISVKNDFVSFEHTHPPHEYILSKNKFEKVNELKKKIYEIINQ